MPTKTREVYVRILLYKDYNNEDSEAIDWDAFSTEFIWAGITGLSSEGCFEEEAFNVYDIEFMIDCIEECLGAPLEEGRCYEVAGKAIVEYTWSDYPFWSDVEGVDSTYWFEGLKAAKLTKEEERKHQIGRWSDWARRSIQCA